MKRKIAAILAADIAGYSRLIAEDEEETLRRLADYQSSFKDYIQRTGGRVFNTAGDSILAEFPSAVDALRCAIDVQESLRLRNLAYPPSRQMAYRVGLTIGDVVDQDGNLLGDGVNIAARLESLAQPGGICISKSLHDAVSSKISAKFVDMGPQHVKNIPLPVHVYSVTINSGTSSRQGEAARKPTVWVVVDRLIHGSRGTQFSPLLLSIAFAVAVAAATITYYVRSTPASRISAVAPPNEALKSPPPTAQSEAQKPSLTAPAASEPKELAAKPPANGSSLAPESEAKVVSGAAPAPAASEAATSTTEHHADERTDAKQSAALEPQQTAKPVEADVAAAARLRQRLWNGCNSNDDSVAVQSCGELIAMRDFSGDDLALAHHKLGLAHRKKGEFDAAIAALTESAKLVSNAAIYNDRGIAFLLKGKALESVSDFSEAINLDAKLGDAWNNRAWAYYKMGRNNDALPDANKAVDLAANQSSSWDTRAHILEALGNRTGAVADFRKALSLEPDLPSSKAGLTRLGAE